MRKLTISIIFTLTLIFVFSLQSAVLASTVYTVQKGDTLSAIAQKYHVSSQSIISANKMVDPNKLSIGQQLNIPGQSAVQTAQTAAAKQPQAPAKYVVKSGDTLSTIARDKRVSINAIIALNKLASPDHLSIGQVLMIPGAGTVVTASRHEELRHDSDKVDALIDYAKSLLGSPYSYGADGPRSFDCSGFTMTVYREVGVDLPHSSAQQAEEGTSVHKSELKRGDLVFFNTTGGGISHVGICIGHNEFIHASSGKGRVAIDSLDSAYYAARYVKARRIL